jgi:Flp pilus assembly pilin Flp
MMWFKSMMSSLAGRVGVGLGDDQSGATTLEWALLLGVIGLPSYALIRVALEALVGYYQMVVMLNSLPFP